jgi:cytoskeletal protein CcmA (bactofilin family)
MNEWLQFGNSSNKLARTYLKEFLDMSGNLVVRNGGLTVTNGTVDISGDTHIRGGLTIDGPINFAGDIIQTDICYNVLISEQVDISNTGTGPALIVRQFGEQPIARFYDDTNLVVSILDGGDVSMNTNLLVGGSSTIEGTLNVSSAASFGSTLDVSGATTLSDTTVIGTLNVTGGSLVVGGATILSDTTVTGTLNAAGQTTLSNTTILGGLNVAGPSVVNNLIVSNETITGTLNIGKLYPTSTPSTMRFTGIFTSWS